MFYSSATLGCLSCASLIANCATCAKNATDPTLTYCSLCNDPYYFDSSSQSCVQCDSRCVSCSSPSTCSNCACNLVLSSSQCVCDTSSDPTLYYDENAQICTSCINVLSNCLVCQPNPLACSSCVNGTYLNVTVCLTCSSSC